MSPALPFSSPDSEARVTLRASAGDTIAALATPVGRSALAVLRISGPDSRRLAAEVFRRPADQIPERRPVYAAYHDLAGNSLDQLVWTYLPGPGSATGEDTLELSCHGNPLIAQLILADLFSRGCRPAEPGEFTRRAFLAGRLDLTQAEAVMDLIHARSERALAVAQRQLRGGLGQRVENLVARLLLALARIEVYVDFPEEDLPPEDRDLVRAALQEVLRGTNRLRATERSGGFLRDGVKTVLLGSPNAGKSSLLNALVGRSRALVGPEPGTTRDYLEELVRIGPHLVRLFDTAGVNPAPGEVERLGMAKTLECLTEADLVLWVVDASRPSLELDPVYADQLRPGKVLVVFNKGDLAAGFIAPPDLPHPTLVVSALTGLGLGELGERMEQAIERLAPTEEGDEEMAVNARQADALRRAGACLGLVLDGLAAMPPAPIELVSSDLRGAVDALGEITGRVDQERMLDALFANFCIGK